MMEATAALPRRRAGAKWHSRDQEASERWVLLLQGSLKEFNLPNIFQLVKMSAKTGALTIRAEKEWGKIFFRDGQIHYAFSVPQSLPLGERLVNAGKITPAQLKEALVEQKKSPDAGRIGNILLDRGYIEREDLEHVVREQIQDAAFNFFGWTEGEFEFAADEEATDQDILVEMNVENVIMEGCRRIDEWELIFQQLGSLERIPHLAYDERVDERGEVTFTAEEWRVIVHVDGHADINTVLHECGLDRFHGAKVIYSLYSSGLILVTDAVIDAIGKGTAIAVRGPIDLYNEIFLATLTDANVTKQMRVELVDDKEIEIPIVAGVVPLGGEAGQGPRRGRRRRRGRGRARLHRQRLLAGEGVGAARRGELGLHHPRQRERRRQREPDP